VLDVRWHQYVAAARRDRKRLRIISEGDSWFAFSITGPALDGAVADHAHAPVLLLDLAANGDTAKDMFASPRLDLLRTVLTRARKARVPPQLLLISAGGNDLLGNLEAVLRKAPGSASPDAWIEPVALSARLQELGTYLDVAVGLRREYAERASLVFHSYAYPTRFGAEGIFGAGPWLDRAFETVGLTSRAVKEAVCERVLDRLYAEVLEPLSRSAPGVGVIDLRTGLSRLSAEKAWFDEIHPSPRGYQTLAKRYLPVLGEWFPEYFPVE
jgi:lysophospholipase L1-like esterase